MIVVFFEIVIIFLLVLLNGFFAMSELAVVSSRKARLRQMAAEGSRGAGVAMTLADDPGRFLPTVQIGITLIGVLAGAFSGATLAKHIASLLIDVPGLGQFSEGLGIASVVIGITYLSLIFGELVPKRIALTDAERVAAVVSRPLAWLSRLGAPAVWLLRLSSDTVLRILRLPTARQVTITDEEVRTLVSEGAAAGVFEVAERDMIDGVMRLADRPVRSIMTPRVDVVWLDLSDSQEDIRRVIVESGRSRFPVSRGGIDAIEGIVHAKDSARPNARGSAIRFGGLPAAAVVCSRGDVGAQAARSVPQLDRAHGARRRRIRQFRGYRYLDRHPCVDRRRISGR